MADLLEQAHSAVDKFVTGVGNALGVDFDEGREFDDADVRNARVSAPVLPPALPAPAMLALPESTTSTKPPAFEIVERGGKIFVTNGIIGQVAPTREFAEQVLVALTAAVTPPASGSASARTGRR